MSFRGWLSRQIFGIDLIKYESVMTELVAIIASEVADLKELTTHLAKETPGSEWSMAVHDSILKIVENMQGLANKIESHQECLMHLMKNDPDVMFTEWGANSIKPNKDTN